MNEIRRCHDGYVVDVDVEMVPALSGSRPGADIAALEAATREAETYVSLVDRLVLDALTLERAETYTEQAGTPWKLHLRLLLPGSGAGAAAGAAKDFRTIWEDAHAATIAEWRKQQLQRRMPSAGSFYDDPLSW